MLAFSDFSPPTRLAEEARHIEIGFPKGPIGKTGPVCFRFRTAEPVRFPLRR
jgi:hypothetical protein